jgi:hypothetical protein
MKQNFFEVHFLGVLLGGRLVLHALQVRTLHKNIASAPSWLAHKYSMERRKEVLII